jgi:hypothetical protein
MDGLLEGLRIRLLAFLQKQAGNVHVPAETGSRDERRWKEVAFNFDGENSVIVDPAAEKTDPGPEPQALLRVVAQSVAVATGFTFRFVFLRGRFVDRRWVNFLPVGS